MDVLVTGAVNEVGRAVAAEFRNAGHRVVITGPNADELEIAAKELEVDAIVCDNAAPTAWKITSSSSPSTSMPS
ncbi:Putative short chain dehydrogenase/reductase [Mycobacteroides abscessus]|nr:Putative short chain dehydrogenase/reductase [Mycobacteroides abscessus]